MGDEGISRFGGGLEAVEHRVSDAAVRRRVQGDDVAAIAFIPRDSRLVHDALARPWRALAETSGVAPPPPTFADAGDFLACLGQRGYAGALAIFAPTLELDEEGTIAGVRFELLAPGLSAGWCGEERNSPSPLDRRRYEVQQDVQAVRIVCWQRFALSNVLHLEGRFASDAPAPFGWIRISYDMLSDGRACAHLASSYLPAVWFYRDGMRVHRVDLTLRSDQEIEAALCPSADRAAGTTHRRIDTGTGYVQEVRS